ncbi:MAG: hypothetical protein ACI8TX_003564 [Hyphomicrobiaceae bacterium]|jgi:hypothetical protein
MLQSISPLRFVAFSLCLVSLLAAAPNVSAALNDCGQPLTTGDDGPKSSDCLFVLRAAVDIDECKLCVCDVTGNGSTSASDALRCLTFAVGREGVELNCPICAVTTTTGGPTSSSTSTSTSTTSTTTTLPVSCNSDSFCSGFENHRCNPNNGLCEEPCTNDTDCKDFFECDVPSAFCVPPAIFPE